MSLSSINFLDLALCHIQIFPQVKMTMQDKYFEPTQDIEGTGKVEIKPGKGTFHPASKNGKTNKISVSGEHFEGR